MVPLFCGYWENIMNEWKQCHSFKFQSLPLLQVVELLAIQFVTKQMSIHILLPEITTLIQCMLQIFSVLFQVLSQGRTDL